MANADRVKGFQPFGPCLRVQPYVAGGAIYEGDLVKMDSAGKVVASTAAAASVGVALAYAAADGDQVLVADHPDQLFIGQCDDNTVDAQTDIGLNASIVAGSPNTTYRTSGMEIDASTVATTATLELRIIRILPAVDNALGEFCKCVVRINNHQQSASTGVAGV